MRRFSIIYILLFSPIFSVYCQISAKSLDTKIQEAKQLAQLDFEKAKTDLELYLEVCHDSKNDTLWIKAANALGHIYTQEVAYEKAENILIETIDFANKKNLPLESANTATFLANLYIKVGSFNKALIYYQMADKAFKLNYFKKGVKQNTFSKTVVIFCKNLYL